MLFLKLLSIIASLFAIYPLYKLIKKDEINIFDLIILFHSIFFCIIPIFSDYASYKSLAGFSFEQNIILRLFVYYVIFIFFLFRIDLFWTKHYKYDKSILNITYYIKTLPQIKTSWLFIAILVANLIISWLWYMPQASYMETFSNFSKLQGYESSPIFLLYTAIFTTCFSFTQILLLKEKLPLKKKNTLLITLIGFALLLLFMPRRIMLFYFILSIIITYSAKRSFFTRKKIVWITTLLIIIIKIYFPFYNVMRNTKIQIDSNNFTTSLIQIIEDTSNHFESKKGYAAESSKSRSLYLYYTLYRIIKYDTSPSEGKLLVAAIDHAIPKFINPNKGEGSAKILEEKTQYKKDQADSILLLAYGDFGLLVGAFYSILLFSAIIGMFVYMNKLNSIFFNNRSTIDILLIVYLISFSWNIEVSLENNFATFVHLGIMSVILIILNTFKIIGYNIQSLKR